MSEPEATLERDPEDVSPEVVVVTGHCGGPKSCVPNRVGDDRRIERSAPLALPGLGSHNSPGDYSRNGLDGAPRHSIGIPRHGLDSTPRVCNGTTTNGTFTNWYGHHPIRSTWGFVSASGFITMSWSIGYTDLCTIRCTKPDLDALPERAIVEFRWSGCTKFR